MFYVEDWPLYPKTAHYSLGLYVTFGFLLSYIINLQLNICRDPQGSRTDAELISSLQRAWLLPKDGPLNPATEAKFSLDSIVGDDG
jgi:hypothetical protein